MEVVFLTVVTIGLVPVLQDYRQQNTSMNAYLAGYLLLILGATATIIEGFLLPDYFNFLEHVYGVAAASAAFLLTTLYSRRRIKEAKQKAEEMARRLR